MPPLHLLSVHADGKDPMDNLFAVLRAGTAAGSSPVERQAAAAVCRAFLIALEATPGEPLLRMPPANAAAEAVPIPPLPSARGERADTIVDSTANIDEAAQEEGVNFDDTEEEDKANDGSADGFSLNAEDPTLDPLAEVQLCEADEVPLPAETNASPFGPLGSVGFHPESHPAVPLDATAIGTMLRTVQALPMEQVLNLAISQLREKLREKGEPIPAAQPPSLRFRLVPIPAEVRALNK